MTTEDPVAQLAGYEAELARVQALGATDRAEAIAAEITARQAAIRAEAAQLRKAAAEAGDGASPLTERAAQLEAAVPPPPKRSAKS